MPLTAQRPGVHIGPLAAEGTRAVRGQTMPAFSYLQNSPARCCAKQAARSAATRSSCCRYGGRGGVEGKDGMGLCKRCEQEGAAIVSPGGE
jgi:hypothetical protein